MHPERPYKRSDRVTSLVQSALNEIILREVDFNGALATITEVEVAPKLDVAKVYVAVLPVERSENVIWVLNQRLPYLQHLLQRKINIRPTPTISFALDKGAERAAGVEKALLEDEKKQSGKN